MDIINPFNHQLQRVSQSLAGSELSLEINRLGFRASAAVLASWGETVVLTTVMVAEPRTDIDYFPLTVDYEERFYAAGKISGSRYVKREGRPSDEAVLIGRLIDRSLRPLFPKDFREQVQIVATVLSLDDNCDPDTPALIGASAGLLLAGLPLAGPVAGCRIGLIDGSVRADLARSDRRAGPLDLIVASNPQGIVMVEAAGDQIPETTIVEGLELGLATNQTAIELQKQLLELVKPQAYSWQPVGPDDNIKTAVADWWAGQPAAITDLDSRSSHRSDQLNQLQKQLIDDLKIDDDQAGFYQAALESLLNHQLRQLIISRRQRPDGRALDQVRPLSSQVRVLPRTHGSALFTRGGTQALNVVTLAPLSLSQSIDTMTENDDKRYFHHYNAPGYTVGEIKRLGSPGRREIGHSYLAEKAILPVLPPEADFPYAIRSVSEIMSQHGSSSMAAACGSCLALMDAGVPLKNPVSGLAMGLIMADDGQPVILTDIQDAEDFAGDLDFKVAGSALGITALQMDMKLPGLPVAILKQALEAAASGRATVLKHMLSVLDRPRSQLSQHAPRVESIIIPVDRIKDVIGKGGETIHKLVADTGTQIDIKDDGRVLLFSPDQAGLERAKKSIIDLTAEPELGHIYTNRPVVKVADFGAFVNILPGKDGMVHVSEITSHRIDNPADYLKVGDKVTVKLIAIDDRGRLNLSIRQAQKK